MVDENELYSNAKKWVIEAGDFIKNSLKQEELIVNTKANANDLVTNIDQGVERFFIEKINSTYPNHQILGEEGEGEEVNNLDGVVWIVDPIDGTMNFVHQRTNFAISVGIFQDGIGMIGIIYDVMNDDLYHCYKGRGAYLNDIRLKPLTEGPLETSVIGINSTWVTENRRIDYRKLTPIVNKCRGTRSYGSAALELAYVASGKLDAYITLRLSPWDFAGGYVILTEVDGILTNIKGEELNFLSVNSVFAAKPGLHKEVLEMIQKQ